MKILQVIPYFRWNYGGPVRVVYEISRELARRGHEVTIYTTDVYRNNNKDDILFDENINVKYFKCLNPKIAEKIKFHYSYEMQKAIKKNIKAFQIVHLHEYRGVPNLFVHWYAKKNNIPFIIEPHGSLPKKLVDQNGFVIFFKTLYEYLFGTALLIDSKMIIALTTHEKYQLIEMGIRDEKISIIPNGINSLEFEDLPQKGLFYKKYGISKNKKIILFLGRIHKTKGLDLLIDAFSDLVLDYPNIVLVIIGPDDGYLNAVKKMILDYKIERNVLITGPLYDKEKISAYVDSAMYILPSIYESFSLTVLEALVCKTPVIVTKEVGISEMINNRGFVIDYNKQQLKNCIDLILKSNFDQSQLQLTRIDVLTNYSWEIVGCRIERLYNEIIKNQ